MPKLQRNDKNNRYAKADPGKAMGPQHYTKNYRQLRNAERKRQSFPGKNTLIDYPIINS